jgi:hypothetical protein
MVNTMEATSLGRHWLSSYKATDCHISLDQLSIRAAKAFCKANMTSTVAPLSTNMLWINWCVINVALHM